MYEAQKIKDALELAFCQMTAQDEDPGDYQVILDELDMDEVARAIRHHAQHVFQYETNSNFPANIHYCGPELFDQRATLICQELVGGVATDVVSSITLELWLMEDMTFALVSCHTTSVESDGFKYVTEYRTVKHTMMDADWLDISPEDVADTLESMCGNPIEDMRTVYYEL